MVETQLGYTKNHTRKLIIRALGIFEEFEHQEVHRWLTY